MGKKSKFIQLILIASLTTSHLGILQGVYAQSTDEENNQELFEQIGMEIPVDFSIALQVDETGPIDQSQIRYDIFAVENGQSVSPPVYSYRHDDPAQTPLSLTPGQYVFRLYDGGQFQRQGFNLIPHGVISNSPDSYEPNQVLSQTGEINSLSDGTQVFDLLFTIDETHISTQTPLLYSIYLVTENVENRLDLNNLVSSQNNTQEPETPGAEESEESEETMVNIQVTDPQDAPVAGVELYVGEYLLFTDENGQATSNEIPAGNYPVAFGQLPEGFEGQEVANKISILDGETNNFSISLESPALPAETRSWTFKAENTDGLPVAGVNILIGDEIFVTDEAGQVQLNDLSAGEYNYEITSVPEGTSPLDGTTSGTIYVGAEGQNLTELTLIQPQEETADLNFQITDSDGQNIPGVTLLVDGQEAVSDASGVLTFTDLPLTTYTYTVNASPDGYQTGQTGEVTLTAEGVTEAITIDEVARYGQVNFRVVDQEENIIPNATIEFEGSTFVSNSAGDILITDILAGREYEVLVNSESLSDEYNQVESETVKIEEGDNGTVDLKVNREVEPAELILNLTDQTNEAVEGADITLSRTETEEILTSQKTNAQGQVVFTDLEAGTYTYRINETPEGYTAQGTPFDIELEEGAQSTQYMQIARAAKVGRAVITVTDQESQAVAGAQVQLADQIVTTNEAGTAVFEEIEAGDYQVETASLPEGFDGLTDADISITPDTTAEITLTVERQAILGRAEITVIDQESQAVAGAQVQLADQIITTNEAGIAVFEEIEAGDYQVETTRLPEGYDGLTDADISITPESTATVTLTVEREIELAQAIVTVVDQNQEIVSGARVQLNDQVITTNESGQAVFEEVAPGSYQVAVQELPEGYEGLTEGDIYLPDGEPTATLTLIVEKEITPGNVEMTFLDEIGEGISGLEISIAGRTQTTDSSGRVNFSELSPGQYDYQVINLPDNYRGSENGQVSVNEGETFSETIEFEEVPATQDVELVIQDTNGQAVPNVTVRLGDQTAQTNAAGVVNFTNITTGNQEAVIESVPAGYEIQERNQTIEVKLDTSNQIEITNIVQTQTESSVEESETEEETNETVSSESSVESTDDVTGAVSEATRRYVDNNTGIEIFLNPADAQQVVRLNVNQVEIPDEDRPSSMQGMEADIYEIQLLSRDNTSVELSRVAQIKLPTRPVTSQVRAVRVNDQTADNLSITIHNQVATINTQQLGTYALIYGAADQASAAIETTTSQEDESQDGQTSVSVTKTQSTESADDGLPRTGETSRVVIYIAAGLLVIAGIILLVRRGRRQ